MTYVREALELAHSTVAEFLADEKNISGLEAAVATMVQTLKGKGRILACGNGGSMCDSMHFVEELTGRYRKNRKPIAAISMGDPSHITCVANDFGYEHIFERNVEAWGRTGDTLLAISTSGNSPNIILAAQKAKEVGMQTVALLGKGGGKLKDMVDVPILVDSTFTDRIQEVHIKCIHIMIEGIERSLFPEHYA